MVACPWDGLEPASIHFCERELCAWVEQPANAYSNLAYLLVGIWVLSTFRRSPAVAALGAIAVLVGLGSFFFHASGTFAGEIADVGAMYLFSAYVLVRNAERLGLGPAGGPRTRIVAIAALALASTALLILEKRLGIVLFSLQVVAAGVLEVRAFRRLREPISRRPLLWLLAFFVAAWTAWWLDLTGVICDPELHLISGHAVWHLLNSLCFPCAARFYAQLEPSGVGE